MMNTVGWTIQEHSRGNDILIIVSKEIEIEDDDFSGKQFLSKQTIPVISATINDDEDLQLCRNLFTILQKNWKAILDGKLNTSNS